MTTRADVFDVWWCFLFKFRSIIIREYTGQLYICHALISKANASPHIQLDTMQLFDTISLLLWEEAANIRARPWKLLLCRKFILCCSFRSNWMILYRLFFFLWQNEDVKPNLEQVQRRDYTTFSVGSHHEATRVVDRLWFEHTEYKEHYI